LRSTDAQGEYGLADPKSLDAEDSNSRYPMGSKLDAMSSVTAVSAKGMLSLTG
jgi:hypothetical protein